MATVPDGYSTALRMLDFFKIPRENGDCIVLLLGHPGLNLLGRYLPSIKINDLLLADVSHVRPTSSHGDIYMMGVEEPDLAEEMQAFDIMDLASFLECVLLHRCIPDPSDHSAQVRDPGYSLLGDATWVRLMFLLQRLH